LVILLPGAWQILEVIPVLFLTDYASPIPVAPFFLATVVVGDNRLEFKENVRSLQSTFHDIPALNLDGFWDNHSPFCDHRHAGFDVAAVNPELV